MLLIKILFGLMILSATVATSVYLPLMRYHYVKYERPRNNE